MAQIAYTYCMIIQYTPSFIQYTTLVSLILDKYQLSVRNIASGYEQNASMFIPVLGDNVFIQQPKQLPKHITFCYCLILDFDQEYLIINYQQHIAFELNLYVLNNRRGYIYNTKLLHSSSMCTILIDFLFFREQTKVYFFHQQNS